MEVFIGSISLYAERESCPPCHSQERWEEAGAEYALPPGTDPAALKELGVQAIHVNPLGSKVRAQQFTVNVSQGCTVIRFKSKHNLAYYAMQDPRTTAAQPK